MGTKGCSLAPYFANQLIEHCETGSPIHAEARLERFEEILKKQANTN